MNTILDLEEYKKYNNISNVKYIFTFGQGVGFGAEFIHLIRLVGSCLSHGKSLQLLRPKFPKGIAVENGFEDYFQPLFPCVESILVEKLSRSHYPADSKFPLIRRICQSVLRTIHPNTMFVFDEAPVNVTDVELEDGTIMPNFWEIRHLIAEMLWRFNEKTNSMIQELNRPFQSNLPNLVLHIRRGDKITESIYTPLEKYVCKINHFSSSKRVYVATDDYTVCEELQELLPNHEVITKQSQDQGYDQKCFNKLPPEDRYRKTVEFLAEVELMRKANWFLGSTPSNVYYLVNILRNGQNSIDVTEA